MDLLSEDFDYPDLEMFKEMIGDHRITVIGQRYNDSSSSVRLNGRCNECGESRMKHRKLRILWGRLI
jgi:hypothetical protein